MKPLARGTKLVVVLLLVSLISVLWGGGQAVAQPVLVVNYGWGTSQQSIKARPGYQGVPFTVEVVEMPNCTVTYGELELYGDPITSTSGAPLAYAAPQPLQTALRVSNTSLAGVSLPVVSSGSAAVLMTFYLDVSKQARPGNYYALLVVHYSNSGKQSLVYDELTLTISGRESVYVADVTWGTQSQPAYPTQGSGLTPLTFYLVDSSEEPLIGVNVTLSLPEGLLSENGERTATLLIPYVQAGGVAQAAFILNVTQAAHVGINPIGVNISYEDTFLARFNSTTSFDVTVYPQAEVSATINAASMQIGGTSQIVLVIENRSPSPIYGLSVQPVFDPLEQVGGNETTVNYLSGESNATFTYVVYAAENLPPSVYPVEFKVFYMDPQPVTQLYTCRVAVAEPAQNLTLSLLPSTLYYQRNNTITVVIRNSGSEVRDLRLTLVPPQGLFVAQGLGPWALGNLSGDREARLKLSVVPSLPESGPLLLQFELTYKNSRGYTSSQEIDQLVYLRGLIEMQLTSFSAPVTAFNGSTVTVSGTLINMGTEGADYVDVYLVPGNWSQPEYVGNIPTNSPTPFSLQINIPSSSDGRYSFNVTITYQDDLGQRYNLTVPFSLNVVSQGVRPKGRLMPWYEYAGIVVLVVTLGVSLYFVSRRRGSGASHGRVEDASRLGFRNPPENESR